MGLGHIRGHQPGGRHDYFTRVRGGVVNEQIPGGNPFSVHPAGSRRSSRLPDVPVFRDLFNGKDLTGWVNVNTAPDTWTRRGRHAGVLRTTHRRDAHRPAVRELRPARRVDAHRTGRQLRHVPVERAPCPNPGSPLPNGVEVQMLELEWPNLHKRRQTPPLAYVHGELFGVGQVKTTPDNPRGERSMSIENRCKGRGEWNTYDVVAVDGVIKLSVNGKFVNGISGARRRRATSAWSPRAPRSTSATSGSWNCRRG